MKQTTIFTEFLSLLKVKFTTEYSNKVFNEHPHKYNLFGLSSLLSDNNTENEAYTITGKEQNINKLPIPFVTHLGADFVVVRKIDNDKATYKRDDKLINLDIDKFCNSWSGVASFAETNEKSQEPEYKRHKKAETFEKLKPVSVAVIKLFFIEFCVITQNIVAIFADSNRQCPVQALD